MNIHDFFEFRSKFVSSTITAYAIGLNNILDPSGEFLLHSDHDQLIIGSYESLHFPILFKQESGKKREDVLNTGAISLYLISDKMKIILEENKITGWKTYPIKLLDKKGNEVIGYHGFSVTGRCGPIDYSKSTVVQRERQIFESTSFWTYYRGLYVGLDRWDGTDFFMPEGNFAIILTTKAADILKKNKFSNVFLRNLADIETHENTVKASIEKRSKL